VSLFLVGVPYVDAFGMVECADVIRAYDAADGYVEFECAAVEIGGNDFFLAISGPTAGNCYSSAVDNVTGVREYLGRIDMVTNQVCIYLRHHNRTR